MHNLATATLEQRLVLTPLLLANVDGDFEMLRALAVPREYPLVVRMLLREKEHSCNDLASAHLDFGSSSVTP